MKNVNQTLFSEEELKILNLSEEQLNNILDADALSKTVDLLPEEPDKILNRLDKEIPDDLEGAFKKIAELSEKDPKFTQQLVAMNEIFGEVKPTEQSSTVQKVSANEMSEQLVKEDVEKIKQILRKK